MSYKIYTQGKYFYIVDTTDGREREGLSSKVTVSRGTTSQDDFYFKNVNNWSETQAVNITEIEDKDGGSYTLDDFIDLYENAPIGSISLTEGNSVNPTVYAYEVALGHVEGASVVNKFGFNLDVDTSEEEVIASFGGSFDPINDIITTSQTFTISYNNSVDGSGTTGALSLLITYLDENFEESTGFHTLGGDGSDVTSFLGLGINRVFVLSNGGDGYNNDDITITATTDGSIQAEIPSGVSVTQQCILHTPINKTFLMDFVKISALRLSGGGAPKVEFRGYSYSRVTNTRYRVFDAVIDTNVENFITITPNEPFVFTGREVIYFTAETDNNNTRVNCRFSGIILDS